MTTFCYFAQFLRCDGSHHSTEVLAPTYSFAKAKAKAMSRAKAILNREPRQDLPRLRVNLRQQGVTLATRLAYRKAPSEWHNSDTDGEED